MDIQLGCMNRAWGAFTIEEALTGISTAGFTMVEFCSQQNVDLIRPDSSDEELDLLHEMLASKNLSFDMIIAGPDLHLPDAGIIPSFDKLAANVARLGGKYILACGGEDESLYDT